MEPPGKQFARTASGTRRSRCCRAIRPLGPGSLVRGQYSGYRARKRSRRRQPGRNLRGGAARDRFLALVRCADLDPGRQVPGQDRDRGAWSSFTRPPRSASPGQSMDHSHNYIRIRFNPEEIIALGAAVRKEGESEDLQPVELTVSRKAADEIPPYARLLQSAMAGDSSLFARADLVEAQWEIVEPVLGNVTPLFFYEPGNLGAARGRPPARRRRRVAQPLKRDSRQLHEQRGAIAACRGRRVGLRRHGGGARAAAGTRADHDRRPLEPSPVPAAALPGGNRRAQPGRHRRAHSPGLPPPVECQVMLADATAVDVERKRVVLADGVRRLRHPHPGDGRHPRLFRP